MVVVLPVRRVVQTVQDLYDQNSFLADPMKTTITLLAVAEGMTEQTTRLNLGARVCTRITHRIAIVSATESATKMRT
jgi:hypothetical protein